MELLCGVLVGLANVFVSPIISFLLNVGIRGPAEFLIETVYQGFLYGTLGC